MPEPANYASNLITNMFQRLSRRNIQDEKSFTPTPEEMSLVEQFGNDRTPYLEVMDSLRQSGIPDSDIEDVWNLVRDLRRSNLGQGKER